MKCLRFLRRLIFFALVFALCACAPSTGSGQATLSDLPTSTIPVSTQLPSGMPSTPTKLIHATSIPLPAVTLEPTSTEIQLPLEVATVVGGQIGCDLPAVELPASDAQGLSDDEIAAKLADMYLDRYTNPQLSTGCRVDGYRIDEIIQLSLGRAKGYIPQGDFLRQVLFSVKLIQLKSLWATYSGKIDQENWLHTGMVIAITKKMNLESKEVYTMELAFP